MSSEKENKKKIPLLKKDSSFKIIIPKTVEAKIRHICSIVHDVEWSGVLFYKPEGSFEDGSFVANCLDIFVMDIGSSGSTEYKESTDILEYRIQNGLLEDGVCEGLIHSHNNMATFFSGTDQNTLVKEGNETNHFVSLIVNNAGSYTAAVTRKVISEKDIKAHFVYTESSYYTTYNNEKIVLEDEVAKEHDKEEKTKDECIEYFDLEIIKEASDNDFEDLDNRLNSIKRSKSKPYSGYLGTQYKKSEPTKPDYDKMYGNYHRYNDYSPSYRQYPYEEYPDYFEYHPTATKAQYDKSNQKSLFDDEDCLYLFDEFDDKIAENLSWQLITGSVLANMEKIDKKKILKNLDGIYEKRFGPLDPDAHRGKGIDTKKNNDDLELWLDSIIGFLLTTEDEGLLRRLNMVGGHKKYTSNDTSELCAMAMFSYIDSLGVDSYAIQVILDCLLVYISEDARKYIKNKNV